jgi:hypothetical protein
MTLSTALALAGATLVVGAAQGAQKDIPNGSFLASNQAICPTLDQLRKAQGYAGEGCEFSLEGDKFTILAESKLDGARVFKVTTRPAKSGFTADEIRKVSPTAVVWDRKPVTGWVRCAGIYFPHGIAGEAY